MDSFLIPWKCLDDTSCPAKPTCIQPKTKKTFAQALSNVCQIPTSQLPQPVLKGDRLAISIPEKAYCTGMDACKFNLHGRIFWPKGATPITVFALKSKLATIWKGLSKWGVTSLGKGYYEFIFTSLEDVKRVRSVASWNLNPGTLKLFAWTKDFDPKTQINTSAQVWVRFYGLAQEYWVQDIIFAIAGSLGTPICTDETTAKPRIERTFGHYARVLVDMDVSQTIKYKLLVERIGFAFFVDVEYENLPDFCSNCKTLGHYVEICKRLNLEDEGIQVTKKKQVREPKKTYVQTKDGRANQGKTPEIQNEGISGAKIDRGNNLESPDSELEREVNEALAIKDVLLNAQREDDRNEEVPEVQNRFLALEDEDIEGNAQEENSETDGDNTHSSEFVDATQLDGINNINHEAGTPHQAGTSKHITQQNSDFLKESWANIAENEVAEANLLKDIESEPVNLNTQNPIPPFQLVTHRKNKAQKSKNTPTTTYPTRSKVGTSKPSQ